MPGPTEDRPRYLGEHLKELRGALVRSLVVVVLLAAAAFWKSEWLFSALLRPFRETLALYPLVAAQVQGLQTLTPIEAFMINMKLAAVAGLVLASPWILREAWLFAAPALKPREHTAVLAAFLLGLAFFCAGVAFGYFVIVPLALRFLMQYNIDYHFLPRWTLQAYFSFVVNFLLIFGILFELPLVLAALAGMGIATPAFLAHKRKHAILGIFILAAFVAPSADPLTQTIVAVPLIALYELGIWLSYLVVRRKP
jgi:sec-independent protein translocase protein TatC